MNPLETIKEWFKSAPNDLQNDLVYNTQRFHVDPGINAISSETKIKEFEEYLDSASLQSHEIVQHAIALRGLISFGICGWDTEEEWEETKKRNEKAAEEMSGSDYESPAIKRFMETYEPRKNNWIKWSNEWKEILQNTLTDKKIRLWHLTSSMKEFESSMRSSTIDLIHSHINSNQQ